MSQHMEALAKANETRSRRTAMLMPLRLGEVRFDELALDAPCLHNMPVHELLMYLPWWKGVRRENRRYRGTRHIRILDAAGISASRTVGKLTLRQRNLLRAMVNEMCPTQRLDCGDSDSRPPAKAGAPTESLSCVGAES